MTNEYHFRFAFTPDWSGEENMGRDWYLGQVAPPACPQVRLYTWDKPTISLGYNQNLARRVDVALCKRDGIPVVVRPTGGRELLHGYDLCYSVVIPVSGRVSAVDARGTFGQINDVLVNGLKRMGINAEWNRFPARVQVSEGPCFAQIDSGEITVAGKKLVASAQRIFDRCILQQGSMPIRPASIDLLDYLVLDDRDSARRRIGRVTTYLGQHGDMTPDPCLVVRELQSAFEEAFEGPGGPVEDLVSVLG